MMRVEIKQNILDGFEYPYNEIRILNIESINIQRNTFIAKEDEEKWEYDLSWIKKVLWISIFNPIPIIDEYGIEIQANIDLDMKNNIVFKDSKGYRSIIGIEQD